MPWPKSKVERFKFKAFFGGAQATGMGGMGGMGQMGMGQMGMGQMEPTRIGTHETSEGLIENWPLKIGHWQMRPPTDQLQFTNFQ
jgi:hypothetical protein